MQFEQRIYLHGQVLAQFRPPSGVRAVDRNQGHGFVHFMMDEELEQLLYLELERYEWRPCTCIHTSIDRFFFSSQVYLIVVISSSILSSYFVI